MLAKRDRCDDALTVARSNFRDPSSVSHLAQALLDLHRPDAAFGLARWGLSLPAEGAGGGPAGTHGRHALACWLRDAAHGASRPDLAVLAAKTAFEASLSRDDYRMAQRLCPTQDWPVMRTTLLRRLMEVPHARDRIDILLDEKLINEAMATVDRNDERFHSSHDARLMRLADAACTVYPGWTIGFAGRMAGPIMAEGRSSHYDLAVHWLEKAARAHALAGTTAKWRARLDALIATHRRKHKLRTLLEGLRTAG